MHANSFTVVYFLWVFLNVMYHRLLSVLIWHQRLS